MRVAASWSAPWAADRRRSNLVFGGSSPIAAHLGWRRYQLPARMNLTAAQPDLFGEPRLAGLSQAAAIATPSEERVLIAGSERCRTIALPVPWMAGQAADGLLRLAL
jgi:hypothetical protein